MFSKRRRQTLDVRAGLLPCRCRNPGLAGQDPGDCQEATSGLALEDARVIVSGGAGVGGREGWKAVRGLAESLGAALGCTRPVVDEGWAPWTA